MDLEFSEDEAQLRDHVREVIDGICPPKLVREVYDGTADVDALWREMVALDWPGMAIDAELGGVGMGFLEVAIVAEQLGRACVPGPLMATTTQFVPAVRELAGDPLRSRLLRAVAAGDLTGTLAVAEQGSWEPAAVQAVAAPARGGRWRLTGTKHAVVDAATADQLVVVARGDAGLGAFLVNAMDVAVVPRRTLDATTPIGDVVLDGAEIDADHVLVEPGPEVERRLGRTIDEATVALATATVGACRAIFDATLDYAKQREQYGRLIGSFQALKHRLADMYLAVERASSVCWYAALTIAEDDPRRSEAVSVAKAAAGECQRLVVKDGLQLHGGIGYTWEHDLHFLLKRAKAGDLLLGTAAAHRAHLARLLGLEPAA
jgi:alkylation response protein AidB-like acyl-CoA dehydrogenase